MNFLECLTLCPIQAVLKFISQAYAKTHRVTLNYIVPNSRTGVTMVKTTWIGDVQSGKHDNQDVELKGWVKRARGNNNIRFVVLRDSTGTIQCVVK